MVKIIILLLGVSLCVALFLFAFLWSVNDGQYDDEYGPPRRILFENKKQNIRK